MKPIDALLTTLRDEGVRRIFGNPGTTELPLLDALVDAPDFDYVLGLQEASVVAMADGHARATQRPSFVNLHVAAGLANGLIGLLNASRSRTPLVVTAGQQDRRHLASDPMLSGDLVRLAAGAVKHTFDVQHAHDLPVVLRRAFRLACQPPAGPVFLSLPMDLLASDEDVELPARSALSTPAAAGGVGAAARMLAEAERPAIVAGDGVGRDGAVAELVAVAERLGAVTYHQPMHDGVDFPGTHPLHGGMLAATNAAINQTLAAHDVVLIVGVHAFMAHHYTPGSAVPRSVRVVQLDADAAEIGRNFAVDCALVGAVRPTLAELARVLEDGVPQAAERIAAAGRARERRLAEFAATVRYGGDVAPLAPPTAAAAVVSGLPEDVVVVEEAITTGLPLRQAFPMDRPGSYVHTVGGGLGSGIGMAVGHALGDPDRPVVAVLGDGCTMFGLQGLWSAAHHGVPVTFVVMNNGEYRTLKETLDNWDSSATRAGRYPGLDLAPPHLEFTKAADFFGIDSVRVGDAGELAEAVAKGAAGTTPLLIEVPITGHQPRRA